MRIKFWDFKRRLMNLMLAFESQQLMFFCFKFWNLNAAFAWASHFIPLDVSLMCETRIWVSTLSDFHCLKVLTFVFSIFFFAVRYSLNPLSKSVTSRFPKYTIAGMQRDLAMHIRIENTPRILVKPQYREINTIYTFILTLNKYKSTCKMVSNHNRYENKIKRKYRQYNKDTLWGIKASVSY